MKKEIEKNKRLSIVDFNFKDVDRFTTFYQIAKDLNKRLVINFKHACYLERYHKDKKLKTPDSRDENILLFKPKRLTGTYIDEDYQDLYIKKRLNLNPHTNIHIMEVGAGTGGTTGFVLKAIQYIMLDTVFYFSN